MNLKESKTIALVANSTWNFFNFRLNIVKAILERGYEVVLISPVDEYLLPLRERYNIQHIPILNLNRKGTNIIQEISLFKELSQIYRKLKPDLVIHFTIKPNIYGNLAAKLQNVRSICVVTGLGYVFLHDTYYNKLAKKLYRYSFKKSDLVVFEIKEDQDLFIEEKLVSPSKSCYVQGCGVNLEYYKPLLHGIPKDNKTVFTFIGRLLIDKGIMEFVSAAKELKERYGNIEFWVAGEIDLGNPSSIDNATLFQWIEEGIIKYFGNLKDIRPIIQKSDCVVLPSYRESVTRALTEAMAMEKPVISSDAPGCNVAVNEGENGFLVPPKDIEALINSFEKFIGLEEKIRIEMGKKGRQKVISEFDDRIIARKFIGFIESFE